MKRMLFNITKLSILFLCLILFSSESITIRAQDSLRPLEILSNMVHSVQRLPNGNTMLAVSYSVRDNEALEIAPDGTIVWRFSEGLNWAHSAYWNPKTDTVLISDTYNNRVIEVNRDKEIIWEYDDDIIYPNDADRLENGNTLITVRDSDKIIEVTPEKKVVWEYRGVKGPHNADRLPNGNTIIANSMKDRIIEVNPEGEIVWEYSGNLNWPRKADRLENGNTLIADSQNARVIEVTKDGEIVWEFRNVPFVYECIRLENGNTLLSANLFPAQALEVDPEGRIVWRWIATSENKIHGFQFKASQKVSYLRQRVADLFRIARNINIQSSDLLPVQEVLSKARQAFSDKRYNENNEFLKIAVNMLEKILVSEIFADFGTVSGYVLDSETKEAVENVEVSLFGTNAVTKTDKEGFFELRNIPVSAARYTLSLEKQGFFNRQVGNIAPTIKRDNSQQTHPKENNFSMDKLNDEEFRLDYLKISAGYLIEHFKKGSVLKPYENSVNDENKYPESVKAYLKFKEEFVSSEIKAFIEKVIASIPKDFEGKAEFLVQRIFEQLIKTGLAVDNSVSFPLDVTARSWQLENGAVSKSSSDWLSNPVQTFEQKRGISYELSELLVTLLRFIKIPTRIAYIKERAVAQWWSQNMEGSGRWVTLDLERAVQTFKERDIVKALEYVITEDEITFYNADEKFGDAFSWASDAELLWRQSYEKPAFFLHNEAEFSNAQFAVSNIAKRGFIGARFDNFGFRDLYSDYRKQPNNYEVYHSGFVFSLANLSHGQEIKVQFPIFVDNEFNQTLDVQIYTNREHWIKEIKSIEKICKQTGKKLFYNLITFIPN